MGAKLKWGILAGVGVVLTILGFGLGFGAFPVIIRDQVEKNLNLFDEDSEGRQNFVSKQTLKVIQCMEF